MLISQGFTNVGSVSVPFSTHALGTKNMVVQAYDAATPAALLDSGSVTVNTGTYEVLVTFRQNQSGIVVLSGTPGVSIMATEGLTVGETVDVEAEVVAEILIGSLLLTGVGV